MKRVEHIRLLLNKYFEGDTSHAEEVELCRFFAESKQLPADMAAYRPLFGYIDEESGSTKFVHRHRRIWLFSIGGSIAASVLLLIGIAGYNGYSSRHADFVIINGEKSTDIRIAQEQARKAFSDVSFSQDDIADDLLPQDMKEVVE